MRCSEFLLQYSDFKDELIDDPDASRRFIAHMSVCHRCARYHEVINLGVSLLRSTDPIEPSAGFRHKLTRRLKAAILKPDPIFAVPVRLAGSLVVAAAVAVLVIEGVTRDGRDIGPAPPPARPMPMVQAHPRPPFVTFGDLSTPGTFLTTGWGTTAGARQTSKALVTLTSLADPE